MKLEKWGLAVLTFQYQHVIRAHWKFSGGICFLWKMLIMSTSKPLVGLCFYGTAHPRNHTRQGILPHPALPRPELTLCPAVVFLWISGMEQRSFLHARIQNDSCLPFFLATVKKQGTHIPHLTSSPPYPVPCGHIHDSPTCPMCPRSSVFLGTNGIGVTLKNCWPGEFHRDGPKRCFSVIEKFKGIFSQFSNNNNVYLHRKYWDFYFCIELGFCLFVCLFI